MTTLFDPLAEIIRQDILTNNGAISFARFMELALYHPMGYYQRNDFTLGREGDFTTAPEISPLFAQCFARQYQQITQQTQANNLLEIGAGTGAFACELLHQLAAQQSLPQQYYIFDISTTLRNKQRDYLSKHAAPFIDRVIWLEQLPTDFVGTIIANEVLDALPVHCFELEDNKIYERKVANGENGFNWHNELAGDELLSALKPVLQECYLPDGYRSEINLNTPSFIRSLADCLSSGVILLADYGYGRQEYYHPQRNRGSLTCFHEHRHHDDPLIMPGLQDITAHVDFTLVAESAVASGLEVLGYTTQAAFLLANGLMAFAEQREQGLSEAESFKLHQAIKTLTMPTEMGDLIKIMGLSKNCEPRVDGLLLLDRLRDL